MLIRHLDLDGRQIHLHNMTNVYTLPEHRGKGLGSQSLKQVERWSRKNEFEFIIVWPSEWSIEFYERNGYKLSKEHMELMLE
ncbi:GNAT family N-acetyltransferase [Paenibacillus thiaminolyticus]|uniref:GNAT family N-acetyltransferase n=1 Tax=Paenibacillus thiaminolyticus TaxID=49283 RepID=UPI0035A6ECE8